MANARVARGRRTQVVIATWLREHGWPLAKSVWGSAPGKDIFDVPGHAIEVKARSDFDPQAWWRQAKKTSAPNQTRLPAYQSVDCRLSKAVVSARYKATMYVEAANLLN